MKRRAVLGGLAAMLAGCGGGGGGGSSPDLEVLSPAVEPPLPATTSPMSSRVHKGEILQTEGIETAMVHSNGEVLAINFLRPWADQATSPRATAIRVVRWHDGSVLAEHPWPACMGCVIVHNGELHIFGSTDISAVGNKVVHSVLDPVTFAPSAPIDALLMNAPANPFRFWNTEVCADPNGFRMVVETSVGVFFARSTDLNAWSFYGGQFNAGSYVGCPTLDYVCGAHYLTWLHHVGGGKFETRVAKSEDDCFTFSYGRALLAPQVLDHLNCSDVDMVEVGGQLQGVYLDGDQRTYARLRRWTYDGTLAEMFHELMPSAEAAR